MEKQDKIKVEITINEIKEVAKECSFIEPNQEQLDYVIENYNAQAETDPSGYWRLWVEQLLYDIYPELNV